MLAFFNEYRTLISGGGFVAVLFAILGGLKWWTHHRNSTALTDEQILENKAKRLATQEELVTKTRDDLIQTLLKQNEAQAAKYEAALVKSKDQCAAEMQAIRQHCLEDTSLLNNRINALQSTLNEIGSRMRTA